MTEGGSALGLALLGDPALYSIVRLSLFGSLSAVAIAAFFGIPFGALLAPVHFAEASAIYHAIDE